VTTNLAYDQASRLKSYGTNATYAYDGGGLRTSKTVSSTTTPFTYDTAEGLPLITDDGTNAYIYGPGGMLIEQVNGTTATYVHQDQLGSTRLLTDAAGTVVGTYQFDAYGNTTSHTGTATTPMQYAGQYLDSESGLYWMRARYYDASTGQFLSRDPAAQVTRSPYGYVDGDPIGMSDPSGLLGWGSVKKFVRSHGVEIVTAAVVVGATVCAISVACGIAVVGAVSSISPLLGTTILAGGAGVGVECGLLARMSSMTSRGAAAPSGATALQRAAAGGGPTTSVATKLTQAPNGSRGLSVAVGEDAADLANAARSEGQIYKADIPTALINELKYQKLAEEKGALMNNVQGTEIRFSRDAWPHIERFFK
jgi:RHS repeat-associated protein